VNQGAIVVLHLVNPNEKYWGILESLAEPGITVRGISLTSFEDWVSAVVHQDEAMALGLTTIFFPMARVERMFLDEPVGQIESLAQSFERRTGMTVGDYLGSGQGRAN
jgi:hypothetical protein